MNSHKVTKHACTHTITLKLWTNNKTNKSYKQLIYIHISCKCDKNRAGHFTLDAHASRPVACGTPFASLKTVLFLLFGYHAGRNFIRQGIVRWQLTCPLDPKIQTVKDMNTFDNTTCRYWPVWIEITFLDTLVLLFSCCWFFVCFVFKIHISYIGNFIVPNM